MSSAIGDLKKQLEEGSKMLDEMESSLSEECSSMERAIQTGYFERNPARVDGLFEFLTRVRIVFATFDVDDARRSGYEIEDGVIARLPSDGPKTLRSKESSEKGILRWRIKVGGGNMSMCWGVVPISQAANHRFLETSGAAAVKSSSTTFGSLGTISVSAGTEIDMTADPREKKLHIDATGSPPVDIPIKYNEPFYLCGILFRNGAVELMPKEACPL
eukprot:TRINITY_DN80516_c0_g1_i1.p1 TRINITY_DN80516_c0_g1~~TRINITY_DN80516_c0_g1_i1.p1  ORF type:complete len:217 (-),score=63.36 TRINITY_DN80516_c0_g1_i1:178-828(-)